MRFHRPEDQISSDLVGYWLEHINFKDICEKIWNVNTNLYEMILSNYCYNHDNNIVIMSVKNLYFAQIKTEIFSFKIIQWRYVLADI